MAFASSRQCEKKTHLISSQKYFPPYYTNQTNETNPYQTINNTADLEFYVNDGKQIAY